MPEFGLKLIYALLIFLAAYTLQRLARRGARMVKARHWLPPTVAVLIGNLVRWGIWICAVLFVLELFGMPIRALWAGLLSVAVLVAVAFVASWSILANILSAVVLLAFSRARIGDIVELRDTKQDEVGMRGKIIDINLFFVTIQELKPELSISETPPFTQIPNHLFFFRVSRCWRGEHTKPLKQAFKEEKVVELPEDKAESKSP
ncbi:mechanosensitive ion channel family protein [Saccharophagus sp. K07]|uniref:mechanosensitive ion channel domain-containing protein n=1 Tax=Saccharophagus sp. K07 TaxID=2283636 RepID=UPI001651F6A4|nr:mechanosensitive ion channel domain-containing protein [Saccharophagus sp. K07]MBC6904504.1 mechanosensitive ion channel family protein [Saccharophagus sp. K07]